MKGFNVVINLVAILIHFVINHDVIMTKSDGNKVKKSYRAFLFGVAAYFLTNCFCNLFILLQVEWVLHILFPLEFIIVFLALILWIDYTVSYLRGTEIVKKIFKGVSIVLLLSSILMLGVNMFFGSIYRLHENGNFETGNMRWLAFGVQMLLFFLTSLRAFGKAMSKTELYVERQLAIAWFGLTMDTACVMQFLFPTTPMISIGYMVGGCILHSFVEEDEKIELIKKNERYIKKLERLESMFVGVSGDMYSGIIFVDMGDFSCVRVNVAKERFYHDDHGPWTEYLAWLLTNVDEKDRDRVCETLNVEALKRLEMNQSETVTYQGIEFHEDGKKHSYSSTVKLIDIGGKPTAVVFSKNVMKDIENQLEENESLSDEWYRAEIASQSKSSFLFNMSHDLRTPMNAIIGFTDLLEKNQDNPEKRKDYLKKMKNANEVLISIINNVLDISKIERGELGSEPRPWNIESFVDSIYFVFREMMDTKNIEYTKKINVTNLVVECDIVSLREVFINLLSNAYKYTPNGGKVSLDVEERECEKEGYMLLVARISDTGVGISEDFMQHLFDEGTRERGNDIREEGNGLGMSIVKDYVCGMDGTIEVKSDKGIGTTFVVSIPLKIVEGVSINSNVIDNSTVDADFLKGKNILIAEDNDLNAQIINEMLSDYGANITHVKNGQECVKAIEESDAGYFDLILMDVQMPVIDGYEATRLIRSVADETKANIPIIALSANAYDKHSREAIRIGMNDYIAKPINVRQLLSVAGKYL